MLATILLLLGARAVAADNAVQFIGAGGFPAEELRTAIGEQLLEIEAKGLTPARADDAAFFLGSFYRKAGYSRVEVKYEISGKTLVLRVQEGPRALLRSLRFEGNKHQDSATLAQYLMGVPVEKLAAEKIPYNEGEVSAGADRVRGLYLSEGWLDVAVDVTGTRVTADGTAAAVVVTIVEGTQYRFGTVTFAGGGDYTNQELVTGLDAKPEGPLTPALVDAMQGGLRSWLRARGHFNAAVTAEWSKTQAKDGLVPVRFTIIPGPKFRVTRVEPRGLDRVTPVFIQHRFSKITGQIYEPAKIDEKYRELLRTGLFRTMHIVPKSEGPDRLRLDLEVEESKQKEFGFELGYGSYEGLIAAVQVGDRNFLRTGRPLSLKIESSQRGFQGELLHVDPWLFESNWSLRSRLYSQVREEEGYSKNAAGLRLEGSRKLTPHLEFTAFTEFAVANVSSDVIDPALLGPLDYTLVSLGVAQKLDYRDNPLNPRRGFVFSTSVDLNAIDGQLAFGRITARYSRYWSLPRTKSILALGLRAGWIIPTGNAVEDVPIDLRYFNGGGSTVRSFAERELGPKDKSGNPIGGAFYTVGNLEWDFPISGPLGGAVFVDAGNLVAESSPSLSDLSFAVGVGLRYDLPIGPMRLDYGYNPSPKEDESIGALHFSFGFAF
jgi:outer membrane protein assembly complex protein YaeT